MVGLSGRKITDDEITVTDSMDRAGLTRSMIAGGITFTYEIIDRIDDSLSPYGFKLANIIELAGFSSIIGDLVTLGVVRASGGRFKRNRPHQYPDVLAISPNAENIEIKVALEGNKPKGHLAKPGNYLTFRYVLGDADGNFVRGKENRQNVPWIWESRFGRLEEEDFNTSNTEGDSGKTANINRNGMTKMKVVFCDDRFDP